METRKLGRTGLEAAVMGLGTEYLVEATRETVVSVVREALDKGVNYFDVLFSYADYRDNFGAALEGRRDEIILTGHLGSADKDGQYRRTRDIAESEALIDDQLTRLHTDHLDVLFLSNCDEADDYRRIMAPGGLLALAGKLQRRGKARFIGLSGHKVPVSRRAVQSGEIDVLMHNINLSGDATEGRTELYHLCAAHDVGLVGMKPFAGGALLGPDGPDVTPVQCLSYAVSQPGVSTLVPGVKNLEELRAALAYLDASTEERDFSAVLPHFQEPAEGTCVYCNHCLPCPSGIDIGKTIRLLVSARHGDLEPFRGHYEALEARASDCTECGACMERCPFGVDVISNMQQAVELFECNPLDDTG
ncbi:MAG: aldo/keto reductase [Candidatus Brocadiae bacterium]|nr:aldo/keto reductase [Candidatus Brocadiia bacterium]